MLFNKTRQYNIQIFNKNICFKYRTEINNLFNLTEMAVWLKSVFGPNIRTVQSKETENLDILSPKKKCIWYTEIGICEIFLKLSILKAKAVF